MARAPSFPSMRPICLLPDLHQPAADSSVSDFILNNPQRWNYLPLLKPTIFAPNYIIQHIIRIRLSLPNLRMILLFGFLKIRIIYESNPPIISLRPTTFPNLVPFTLSDQWKEDSRISSFLTLKLYQNDRKTGLNNQMILKRQNKR